MPVTVIFGGQFGSEGKGKTAFYFAKEQNAKAVIRVGGPNSGHTVIDDHGNAIVFKHLPTAAIMKGVKSVLTAGHYINLNILKNEIALSKIEVDDLYIDPYSVIVTNANIEEEQKEGLKENIGSTGSGLGSVIKSRIERRNDIVFAKDIDYLKPFIKETNPYLRTLLKNGERVIIEGTQGFGLSLLHTNHFPFCTSRDTSAAAFVSEAGLSPIDVVDVIMVIRTFPIRVGGNSGPLKNEITWEEITKIAKSETTIQEFTSVTKKLRRVAHFDEEIVKRTISYNQPTKIILNHADYLGYKSVSNFNNYLNKLEEKISRRIDYIGFDRKSLIRKKELSFFLNQLKANEYA
jgi:adenylosuccinate synthase